MRRGVIFLSSCTRSAIARTLFNTNTNYGIVWSTLGLAYVPLMLSFLVALPYLGVPVQVLLSVWTLLAFVIGLHVTLSLGIWQAFWCCVLGWFVFQMFRTTNTRMTHGLTAKIRVEMSELEEYSTVAVD